ncbi:MAG: class I SAM-dependent methyltransferase [Burkholderiaceae bacterium]
MPTITPKHDPLVDERVRSVIERVINETRRPGDGGPRGNHGASENPQDYAQFGFPIAREQGELMYLLCRGLRARLVVEFATSFGLSSLYLAAALRDNGGGRLIGSELVPEKVAQARRNLADAGLAEYADIRQGDARETLSRIKGPIDFVLIDGWPTTTGPSLARQVAEILVPHVRTGGYVMNDNAEGDYLEFIRNPSLGFVSVTLPIKSATELSLKLD